MFQCLLAKQPRERTRGAHRKGREEKGREEKGRKEKGREGLCTAARLSAGGEVMFSVPLFPG